ncbi:MAG: mechanosensitive ion channel [Proteobacteria bacterium]|nr:mechanosensitive ion channel [Pseudomonadota bacterium]MBU1686886.1 mechanosensitive ion channel [Pseudomonadota bacterium]
MNRVDLIDILDAGRNSFDLFLTKRVLTFPTLIQLILVLGGFLLAFLVARSIQQHRRTIVRRFTNPWLRHTILLFVAMALPAIWFITQAVLFIFLHSIGWPTDLLGTVLSLLTAWLVIQLFAGMFQGSGWVRVIASLAWLIAALNITGLLVPVGELLDSLAFRVGTMRLSILSLVKGGTVLGGFLWLANATFQFFEHRISVSLDISPSIRVLIFKLLKITVITVAILTAMASIGIDITGFAVFTGAIGVGIGFGLQKIIGNLISGIILLLDKSVKPGDVIAINDNFGWVNSLNARYTSLLTRDGIEYLIPNEDMITNRVENWSHSDNLVRIKLQVGISYESDVHLAISLCLDSALKTPRILPEPQPVCLLTGFGDSSVNLELRAWINDPVSGVANVKSDILLAIWDTFHTNNIQIPFPQRDIHIKSSPEFLKDSSGKEQKTA